MNQAPAKQRDKVAFLASSSETAQAALETLCVRYDSVAPEQADVIVALGGDGFMLQTLHRFMDRGTPVYGMNRGSVGFLMNAYAEEDLLQRIEQASEEILHPLQMRAFDESGALAAAGMARAEASSPESRPRRESREKSSLFMARS